MSLQYCTKIQDSVAQNLGTYEVIASDLSVRTGPGENYRRKTYNELLKHEYPITDLVTIEKDTLSIEIILLEKYRDHLLLGLDVTLLGSKKICCKNSIRRTFTVYNK